MATDFFEVKVLGLAALERALQELADPAARRALKKGGRVGANVIRDEARSKAPKDSGLLKSQIRVRALRDRPGSVAFKIGVKTEKRVYANNRYNRGKRRAGKKYEIAGPGYYGRFLEYGTSQMGARPFLRPAAEVKTEVAVTAMRDALAEAIEQEMRRARR